MNIDRFLTFLAGVVIVLAVSAVLLQLRAQQRIGREADRRFREEIDEAEIKAESRAEREPDKIRPAWDLARTTLEAYFNRNLIQVTAIFWLSTVVMTAGFLVIILGVVLALISRQDSHLALVTILTGSAGVVTELIGATFLFVYRSTVQQASSYTKTLERINSVGMAMQILDTIADDAQKDTLKESVVKSLMQHPLLDINTSD